MELGRSNYKAERRRYTEQRQYYGGVASGAGLKSDVIGAELPELTPTEKKAEGKTSANTTTKNKEERLKAMGF